MDIATQHHLIDRILTHLDRRTTDAGGEERYVPVTDYLDPRLYAAEVEAAHRSRPLIVGHASQLAEPGDFLTDQVAGTPGLGHIGWRVHLGQALTAGVQQVRK